MADAHGPWGFVKRDLPRCHGAGEHRQVWVEWRVCEKMRGSKNPVLGTRGGRMWVGSGARGPRGAGEGACLGPHLSHPTSPQGLELPPRRGPRGGDRAVLGSPACLAFWISLGPLPPSPLASGQDLETLPV